MDSEDGAPPSSDATADGPPPRWDEGLTKAEKAEARRKYKNRRGAERWRRRKLEQLVRSAMEEADGGTDDQSLDAGTSASLEERMLNEHKKLGKAAESDLMAELEQLAAFSILDSCLQRHKKEILEIVERAVYIVRGGKPTVASSAHRQLEFGFQQRPEWNSPSTPTHVEVCAAFAEGRAGNIVVPVNLASRPNTHRSLERLAALSPCVQLDLYMAGVEGIVSLLPVAFGNGSGPATAAAGVISQRCREVAMLMATYTIGQPGDFSIRRAVCQPFDVPIGQLMSAAASLCLDANTCRQLWHIWDDCMDKLAPLQAAQRKIEQEVEDALQALEVEGAKAYQRLLEKAEMLLILHEEVYEVGHWLDLKCSLEVFTPFEVGILAAAQLPRTSTRQARLTGIDPLFRMSTIFESGLIPYRNG